MLLIHFEKQTPYKTMKQSSTPNSSMLEKLVILLLCIAILSAQTQNQQDEQRDLDRNARSSDVCSASIVQYILNTFERICERSDEQNRQQTNRILQHQREQTSLILDGLDRIAQSLNVGNSQRLNQQSANQRSSRSSAISDLLDRTNTALRYCQQSQNAQIPNSDSVTNQNQQQTTQISSNVQETSTVLASAGELSISSNSNNRNYLSRVQRHRQGEDSPTNANSQIRSGVHINLSQPPQTVRRSNQITRALENDPTRGRAQFQATRSIRACIIPWGVDSWGAVHGNKIVPGLSLAPVPATSTNSAGTSLNDEYEQLSNYCQTLTISNSLSTRQAVRTAILEQFPQWNYLHTVHNVRFFLMEREERQRGNRRARAGKLVRLGACESHTQWVHTRSWINNYAVYIRRAANSRTGGKETRSTPLLIMQAQSPFPQGTVVRASEYNTVWNNGRLPINDNSPNTLSIRNGVRPIAIPDRIHGIALQTNLVLAERRRRATAIASNHRPYLQTVMLNYGIHTDSTQPSIAQMIQTINSHFERIGGDDIIPYVPNNSQPQNSLTAASHEAPSSSTNIQSDQSQSGVAINNRGATTSSSTTIQNDQPLTAASHEAASSSTNIQSDQSQSGVAINNRGATTSSSTTVQSEQSQSANESLDEVTASSSSELNAENGDASNERGATTASSPTVQSEQSQSANESLDEVTASSLSELNAESGNNRRRNPRRTRRRRRIRRPGPNMVVSQEDTVPVTEDERGALIDLTQDDSETVASDDEPFARLYLTPQFMERLSSRDLTWDLARNLINSVLPEMRRLVSHDTNWPTTTEPARVAEMDRTLYITETERHFNEMLNSLDADNIVHIIREQTLQQYIQQTFSHVLVPFIFSIIHLFRGNAEEAARISRRWQRPFPWFFDYAQYLQAHWMQQSSFRRLNEADWDSWIANNYIMNVLQEEFMQDLEGWNVNIHNHLSHRFAFHSTIRGLISAARVDDFGSIAAPTASRRRNNIVSFYPVIYSLQNIAVRAQNDYVRTSDDPDAMWTSFVARVQNSALRLNSPTILINGFIQTRHSGIELTSSPDTIDVGGPSRTYFNSLFNHACQTLFVGVNERIGNYLPVNGASLDDEVIFQNVLALAWSVTHNRLGFGTQFHSIVLEAIKGNLNAVTLSSATGADVERHLSDWFGGEQPFLNDVQNEGGVTFELSEAALQILTYSSAGWGDVDTAALSIVTNRANALAMVWRKVCAAMQRNLQVIQQVFYPFFIVKLREHDQDIELEQIEDFLRSGNRLTTEEVIEGFRSAQRNILDMEPPAVRNSVDFVVDWLREHGDSVITFNDRHHPRQLTAAQQLSEWVRADNRFVNGLRVSVDGESAQRRNYEYLLSASACSGALHVFSGVLPANVDRRTQINAQLTGMFLSGNRMIFNTYGRA